MDQIIFGDDQISAEGRKGIRRGTQRSSSAFLCEYLCVPLR